MFRTPRADKGKKYPAQRTSRRSEKKLAAELGGKVTKGSGNKDEKGDVRVKGVFRIENKDTQHKSFSITREMIDKIESAALHCNELPFIQVTFIDDSENVISRLAVCPKYVLDEFKNALDLIKTLEEQLRVTI